MFNVNDEVRYIGPSTAYLPNRERPGKVTATNEYGLVRVFFDGLRPYPHVWITQRNLEVIKPAEEETD